MVHIAHTAKKMGGESAYTVLARAKELEATGKSIVHLEIGQPDFKTPAHIVRAGIRAIREGKTRYTATLGIPELRKAIAKHISQRRNMPVATDQVAVTPSAKMAIYVAMASVINPGDEVIYPNPGFPAYENVIVFLGGIPRPLPLLEKNDFSFDPRTLERLISKKTRLIILNSPSNPTGSVIPRRDLLALAPIIKKHPGLYVLTDEIYSDLCYGGAKLSSIYSIPDMAQRTFLVDGFSKTHSMTGWRLGYLIAPKPFMETIDHIGVNTYACPAEFTQYAGIAAVSSPESKIDVRKMVRAFEKRRDVLVAGLNKIPGITCHMPHGAFYAFPNIVGTGMSSEKLATALLEDAGVAVLAGTAFGSYGEGYLRISYANSLQNIREGLRRIEVFLRQ